MKNYLACLTCAVALAGCGHRAEQKNTGLYLPDDLEATLWAESPMFYNPTNMDVDSRGRIWVTEAVNYRNYNNDSASFLHHTQGDRIIILEDTDHDGKADLSKVFVQDRDLLSPVGIAVIGNKIVVSCSPNLIVYTDSNGDDVPDSKEVLLTGFGGKDHDHSLHSVTAGADGNWYFNVGDAGPHTVTDRSGWTLRSGSVYTGGSPYNITNEGNRKSDDGKVWVGGMALAMRPDGTHLRVVGHNFRNAYEVVTDSYGNLWQNDNDDQVLACRTTWLMEGGNAGYFSNDGTRYWQADQRPDQDMFTAHWHQEDPGVIPAGDCSGAGAPTGIVMNEGDGLGPRYRGMLFSADAGRNIVFGYTPAVHGSGYDLGKRQNTITSVSNDNEEYVWNDSAQNAQHEKWFRPADVTIGTDGALYIADWYDPVVGGHQMKDSAGYGRIYRIVPKHSHLVSPVIDLSTTDGQLTALKSPAVNVRNAGFEKLSAQGPSVIEKVKALLSDPNPYVRARAVWLLSSLGPPGLQIVENLLSDTSELVRATSFRSLRQASPNLMVYAKKLTDDPSPLVRREVAIALRDSAFLSKKDILLRLALQYVPGDRWYLEALGAAMEANAGEWYSILKEQLAPAALADFAWRLHPKNAVQDIVQRATDSLVPATERKRMLTALSFINDKSAVRAMLTIASSTQTDLREQANYWLSFRQSNDWQGLMNWSHVAINTEYERKLAAMKVKRQVVLNERLPNDERTWRAEEMASDSVGGQMLIGLLADKKLPPMLVPVVQKKIFNNPDISVRVQAGKYLSRPGSTNNYSIEGIAQTPGDASHGKTVFTNHCSTCHRVQAIGNNIGPDLSSINKKFDKIALLDAIINPGAAVVFGYEPLLINTRDGQSFAGFLVAESKQSLTIKDLAGNRRVVAQTAITSRQKQEGSIMPDAATIGLSAKDLADIAAFLLSAKKM